MNLDMSLLGFAVPFLVASVDLWLHSPVPQPYKHVALGLSALALPVGKFEAFVGAQLVWLVLIVVTMLTGEEVAKPAAAAAPAEEKPVETGPPAVAAEGKKRLEEALKKLMLNFNEATNCDGKPWKLQQDKDGIKVYNSDLAGASTKRWKVETTIKGITLEEITDELFNFEKRCGPGGWDTAIKEASVVTEFKDDYSIARMVTNAAGGGAISSREFIDLRMRVNESRSEHIKDGFLVASVGIDPKKDKKWLPQAPAPNKSYVLGNSYPGGGVKIEKKGEKEYAYTMVSNMNLNGWIPTSVINTATAGALVESHQAMHAHLKKKFA